MDWRSFFDDLQKWMGASNEVMKKCPIESEEYWGWLYQSMGQLGNKYANHPLVLNFLSGIIGYQESNLKNVIGR